MDPVCEREIDDVEYPEQAEYNDRIYYFCSLDHYQEFLKHPEKYAKEEYGEPVKQQSR